MTVSAFETPFSVNDPRLAFDATTHTYRLGERVLPSVTQILRDAGVVDFSAPWFTPEVLERGSFVHQAIALDVEGALDEDTLDPALAPYLAGWRLFLAETGYEVERWETPVVDPVLGYAGTLDGILRGRDAGPRRLLIDIKRGFYPSAGPQTAAYKRLALKFYRELVVFDRAVVELPGDGRYRFHRLTDPADEGLFLAALRIVNWRRAHGSR